MSIFYIILFALGFWAMLSGLLLITLKEWRKVGIVLILVYITTYIPFSLDGRYELGNHGGNDWRMEWCPQHLMHVYRVWIRTKTGSTRYGKIYLPCILLDRLIWHPSRQTEG